MAMDPQVAQGIPTAADSQVTQFVRVVAERQMLVQAAEEAGTALTPEDWAYLRATHDRPSARLQVVNSILSACATRPRRPTDARSRRWRASTTT
jgi:hypothetical protein